MVASRNDGRICLINKISFWEGERMSYLLCIMASVIISTSIMFYVLKVVVTRIFEVIKEDSNMGMKYTNDMCEISVNGILEILKKRGVIDKDTKPISIDKN